MMAKHMYIILLLLLRQVGGMQILTAQQEAFLDSHSYPWCPDMWQMAQLLAVGKTEPDVKESTADLNLSGVALSSLLPDRTGFQVLTQPFTARGLGLRLKRERCCFFD